MNFKVDCFILDISAHELYKINKNKNENGRKKF